MIKLILNLFKRKTDSVDSILKYPEGKRYYRDAHNIRKNLIDEDALKIIHRLNKFGYKAFIVGGGVRDLLLGRKPKDFDVATSATPNQIKKVFNNCRIIGKRFKIVHVLFKGKIIEVSTFRSIPEYRFSKPKDDQDYLIKRDNKFGTSKEDSARRDFTINSLYYDPRNDSILDYVGGFEDIQNKILRVIGNPEISFKEDPVRMLRAVKFAVMLGLTIDKKTIQEIKKHRHELEKASASRMLEEYNKIFRSHKTATIFKGLAESHLLEAMMPEAFEKSKKRQNWGEEFLEYGVGKKLALADKMLTEREELTPSIYFALLFSDMVADATPKDSHNVVHHIKNILDPIFERLNMPKKEKDRLIKIFASQKRFLKTDDDKASQNDFFRKKDFFYDSFMVYKISAIADNVEAAIQSAFFWEISVRKRPIPARTIAKRFNNNRENNGAGNNNGNGNNNRERRPFDSNRRPKPQDEKRDFDKTENRNQNPRRNQPEESESPSETPAPVPTPRQNNSQGNHGNGNIKREDRPERQPGQQGQGHPRRRPHNNNRHRQNQNVNSENPIQDMQKEFHAEQKKSPEGDES